MDMQFFDLAYRPHEMNHCYGDHIHILKNPLSLALLARLGSPETTQPVITHLLTTLYQMLVYEAVAAEFPRIMASVPTRMHSVSPQGIWQGEIPDPDTRVVVVALARAGLLPSQITYDFLNHTFHPAHIRQDHLSMARMVDDKGRVTGAELYASKIGGKIEDAIVLIPDPMGATGSTVGQVLSHYSEAGRGVPKRVIALHLIITPEYLRFLQEHHPQVIVYALRLDRGLSPATVLQTLPGSHWHQERGLTDKHYIVPGAGGLGEVLNNVFV